MRWFKHYNDASDGHSFQQLISEKDYEALFIYWWILEQISKFEDQENRGKVTLKFSYFKMKLNQNRQRITKVLQKIAQTFDLEVSINSDETVTLFVRKWSELQENRGGKRDPNTEAKVEQKPTDVRGKKIDVRIKNKDTELEPSGAVADFLNFWNSFEKLPKILKLTKKRKEKIEARLSEKAFDYQQVITMISLSDFLLGIAPNSDGWRADLDWLIANESNYIKVLEGKYKNKAANGPSGSKEQQVFNIANEQIRKINAGEL